MIYALIGAAALLATICIITAQTRDTDPTPPGYDPAPREDERGIRVNPGRPPW